jgi:hypothetical protein
VSFPSLPDAWYYRGAMFEKQKRLEEAIADFTQVN